MRTTYVDPARLRRLRVERMITCAELSRRAGLSRSMLKYLETGERSASEITAVKIARALDVDPAILAVAG